MVNSLVLTTLVVASFLTSTLSATIGMAGGIVLLSVMTFFLPLNVIIPVHGIVQLVSNISRSYLLRKKIVWPIVGYFCLGLPLGTFFAIKIIKKIDNPNFALGLIALLILYTVFKPKKMPHLQIPMWAFSFLGLLVGVLGPLIGATGPTIAMFFLRDDLNKKQVVATKAAVQVTGHVVKIPAFLYLGFQYQDYSVLIIAMVLVTFLGTRLGVHLLNKVQEHQFVLIFKTALFVSAVRILYKIIFA